MSKTNFPTLSFNHGRVSQLALARVDLERMRFAAEEQVNWTPRTVGPMILRSGLGYLGGIKGNLPEKILPFIFSNQDLALLELTENVLRVWLVDGDDETLLTRAAVATVVTNGDFSSATGWTATETGSGASATISGGKLNMTSPATGGLAQVKRAVTVASGDQNVAHAFRITVDRGPIIFRAGSTDGDDDFVTETMLGTGTHSIGFTPTGGSVYIQLETRTAQIKIVDSITIEASGIVELPTPWVEEDLPFIRYDQSGDVVFIACEGVQQRRIERRADGSWSVVLYAPEDGPFGVANISDITLTPSVLSGNGTLTASRNVFRSTHVGCLFRLFSSGQTEEASLVAENTFGDAVRVTGVGITRYLNYAIAGTWTGAVTLQRSFTSATTGFTDVARLTANTSDVYNDTLDNSIVWYRWGIKTGDYGTGTADVTLSFAAGGGSGVCRVTGYTSRTVVDIEVLSSFSSLTATSDWSEGDWSDVSGYPSAVRFHEGRLWWGGRDRIWGSVSDSFSSFDVDYEGDAGPLNRSIGFGPVDSVMWLEAGLRLVVGRQGAESPIRSSGFDEPLSPTNFAIRDCETQGSAPVQAVRVGGRIVFVQKSQRRIYQLVYSVEGQDYSASDLTALLPDETSNFIHIAVQRQPDTRLHFVRADGTVSVLLLEPTEEVVCWFDIETDGLVEDVIVLPGEVEDRVYYVVKRTIDGNTVRYLERFATEADCIGGATNKLLDSHVVWTGASSATVTGLSHLEGETVSVWANGKALGEETVSSGQITISEAATLAVVGLPYEARFKSAKLAYGAQLGTALSQRKRINYLGLMLRNVHPDGLYFGQSFDAMDPLPSVKDGATMSATAIVENWDDDPIEVPGEWSTDARLCLKATAPKPCTVLGAVVGMVTHEK